MRPVARTAWALALQLGAAAAIVAALLGAAWLDPRSQPLWLVLIDRSDSMPRAGLSEIHFGDDGALRGVFERRVFWQSTAPMFISGLLSLTALLSLSLWLSRRKETVFAFFLLQCLATKARIWHTFARDPDSLGWLIAAPSLTWMMAMQTSFALRFCEQKAPRFEKFM